MRKAFLWFIQYGQIIALSSGGVCSMEARIYTYNVKYSFSSSVFYYCSNKDGRIHRILQSYFGVSRYDIIELLKEMEWKS